jgi:hypothetical protein
MKSKKNDSKKKAISFDGLALDKKELLNIYGGGTFYWDPQTKTMYYVP